MKHEGWKLTLALIASALLFGIGNALAPYGMVLFWVGLFVILKPFLGMRTWMHALSAGAIASILYFLVSPRL